MPKCPKCQENIDCFDYSSKELNGGSAWIEEWENSDGQREYSMFHMDKYCEVQSATYMCPRCGAVLFDNEDDAMKFAAGEYRADVPSMS